MTRFLRARTRRSSSVARSLASRWVESQLLLMPKLPKVRKNNHDLDQELRLFRYVLSLTKM